MSRPLPLRPWRLQLFFDDEHGNIRKARRLPSSWGAARAAATYAPRHACLQRSAVCNTTHLAALPAEALQGIVAPLPGSTCGPCCFHSPPLQVSRLGVVSILVDTSTGVSLAALERGLQAFADAKQAALESGSI